MSITKLAAKVNSTAPHITVPTYNNLCEHHSSLSMRAFIVIDIVIICNCADKLHIIVTCLNLLPHIYYFTMCTIQHRFDVWNVFFINWKLSVSERIRLRIGLTKERTVWNMWSELWMFRIFVTIRCNKHAILIAETRDTSFKDNDDLPHLVYSLIIRDHSYVTTSHCDVLYCF